MLKVASDGTDRQIDCCSARLPRHLFQRAVTTTMVTATSTMQQHRLEADGNVGNNNETMM